MKKLQKRSGFVLLTFFLLLVLSRLALPWVLKRYVNQVLNQLPGYTGSVSDIDIALYRGAYQIEGLRLIEKSAKTDVPMLEIPNVDISLEWRSLFKGKVVSEIILERPRFIYVFENQKTVKTTTETEDWSRALTNLVPININSFTVNQGKIAFVQISADPNIDLYIDDLSLYARNLRNVVRTGEKLPSSVKVTGTSVGEGKFNLEGDMDLVRKIPDLDISFSLEKGDATALNPFIRHYAGIDFKGGKYNVFGEIAIADGFLKGYVKPILEDTKMIGKEDGFLETIWEGFVGFFKFIFKNKSKNTLATKIPFEGNLNKVKTKTFPSIINIVKNGWIRAYEGKIDNDVKFEDINPSSN
ncbi:DUF748 domain-containing protein [Ascidiimonas aurantiaca]|uniref:DUF748 domain-containing protein n=1 Tax=Ascidiimonas aurantiaca TaxID=1685432 RepID=UPI0030EBE9C0